MPLRCNGTKYPVIRTTQLILCCICLIWEGVNCCDFEKLNISNDKIFHLNKNDLLCAIRNVKYRTKASLQLCEYYIRHDNVIGAYKYALNALTTSPDIAEGYECLSKVHFLQGNTLRASFYAELASRTASVYGKYSHCESNIFGFLSGHAAEAMHPVYTFAHTDTSHWQRWQRRLTTILNGSVTMLAAYNAVASDLPFGLRGPYIVAYEAFLSTTEDTILSTPRTQRSTYTQSRDMYIRPPYVALSQGTPLDLSRSAEFPPLHWPLSRTLVLYYSITTAFTFGENLLGLSDLLNRLGIPHRMTFAMLQNEDFLAIEPSAPFLMAENRQYIVWNYEKNPKLVTRYVEETGFGNPDECGRDEARYDREYIQRAFRLWESIPANMARWRREIDHLNGMVCRGEAVCVKGEHIAVPRVIRSSCPMRYMEMAATEILFRGTFLHQLCVFYYA